MKKFLIKKSILDGSISIPTSKSQTMRAILFASLAKGKSKIKNFLSSPDTLAMIDGCKKFKAKIEIIGNEIHIEGVNQKIDLLDDQTLDVKNSGIALRFLSSIYALDDKPIKIIGDKSISTNRDQKPLLEALTYMGAKITSNNGYAPLSIKGPIKPKEITILGEDSQYISSLLIASSLLDKETIIKIGRASCRERV